MNIASDRYRARELGGVRAWFAKLYAKGAASLIRSIKGHIQRSLMEMGSSSRAES